jgi:hypothetical protein
MEILALIQRFLFGLLDVEIQEDVRALVDFDGIFDWERRRAALVGSPPRYLQRILKN